MNKEIFARLVGLVNLQHMFREVVVAAVRPRRLEVRQRGEIGVAVAKIRVATRQAVSAATSHQVCGGVVISVDQTQYKK